MSLSLLALPSRANETQKALLVDQLIAITHPDSRIVGKVVTNTVEALYAAGLDSRKMKVFVSKVNVDQIRTQLRELWSKNYSEAELDYFIKLAQSGPIKRMSDHNERIESKMRPIAVLSMKDNFKRATGFEPKTQPKQLTRMIWRFFPETRVKCEK